MTAPSELSGYQLGILRGFARSEYFQMSASESGAPDVQELFDHGLVESYWGCGVMWHLTRKGRELAVELGMLKTADRFVIDASTGKVERVP